MVIALYVICALDDKAREVGHARRSRDFRFLVLGVSFLKFYDIPRKTWSTNFPFDIL